MGRVEIISISFQQLKDFWKLSNDSPNLELLVLFVPIWDKDSTYETKLAQCLFNSRRLLVADKEEKSVLQFFKIIVNGQDQAESYVVDKLLVKQLPYAVLYANGGKVVYTMDKSKLSEQNANRNLIGLISSLALSKGQLKTFLHTRMIINALFSPSEHEDNNQSTDEPFILRFFIAGSRSTAGKSSLCLALLRSLVTRFGVNPSMLSYIKPVTQCEAEQPITRFCRKYAISCVPIGPIVFYKGFTRAFLSGETESSSSLLRQVVKSVNNCSVGCRLQLVDGVGYPAVGSICGVSNADVAKALDIPVLMVGKAGVGDAVDSYNLDTNYFRAQGLRVMGGIFNMLPKEGFYSLDNCREAVTDYFNKFNPEEMPYGFIPEIALPVETNSTTVEEQEEQFQEALVDSLIDNVQLERLLLDLWLHEFFRKKSTYEVYSDGKIALLDSESAGLSTQVAYTTEWHLEAARIGPGKNVETAAASIPSRKRPRNRIEIENEARSKGAPAGG